MLKFNKYTKKLSKDKTTDVDQNRNQDEISRILVVSQIHLNLVEKTLKKFEQAYH